LRVRPWVSSRDKLVGSSRRAEAQIDAGTNFRHYVEITQTAERGKFDLMFVADAVAVREGKLAALSRWPQYMAYFDPLTLLPALAAVTSRIGVVGTATTSYNEPYHIARKFASLDLISNGRAGWNVVTSSAVNEAQNFGREQHYAHDERYDRANEFVEVVKGLWDSWEDDAFLRDRATGRYFDPTKLHALNHKGKHFNVRGPLNVARPPQGHPVIFQAGSSEAGRDSAARFAEGVFTPQHTLAGAQDFYRDLKGRMKKYGRPPKASKFWPGLKRFSAAPPRKHMKSTAFCSRRSTRMSVSNCCRTSSTTWICPNTTLTVRCPRSPIMLPRSPVRPRCATSFAGRGKRG